MKYLVKYIFLWLILFVFSFIGRAQVTSPYCGATMSNIEGNITCYYNYANPNVTYRWTIENGASVRTHYTTVNNFKLTDVEGGVQYSTTYKVSVSPSPFGSREPCVVTTPPEPQNGVLSKFCNAVLPSINSFIYSFRDDLADKYRFEFSEGDNVEVIETSTNKIRLADLAKVKASTTYRVRVQRKYNGQWGTFSASCQITTPEFSVLVPTQCGQSTTSMNSLIYCYIKQNTDQYTFEVSDDTNTRTIQSTTNKFSLSQLGGGNTYNKTYNVRVAIRQNGIQGDFGRPCTITPMLLTNLVDSQCGANLSDVNSMIYAYIKPDVEEYRFEISNGTDTFYHTVDINKFRLTDIPGLAIHDTSYSIRVATKVQGRWSSYGKACTVTTPAAPLTRLVDAQCGIELVSEFTMLYCYRNINAEAYMFEVSRNGVFEEFEFEHNKFWFSSINDVAFNAEYTVRAKAKYNGVWTNYGVACKVKTPDRTKLVNTQCNTELATLYAPIYCYIKQDVEEYTFEVTNDAEVRYYSTTDNKFKLSDLTGKGKYETDYEIRVAIKKNGEERGGFGDMCTIRTPIKPLSELVSQWCGEELENVDTWVFCYRYDNAERYRFKVSDYTGSQIIETSTNKFKLSDLSREIRSEGIYNVSVSVKYDDQWVSYGKNCWVVSPKTTELVDSMCSGFLTSMDQYIYCKVRPGVDEYVFEVTEGNNIRTYRTSENRFRLTDLEGGGAMSTQYSVRVAIVASGKQRDFGKVCSIVSPSISLLPNYCGSTVDIDDDITINGIQGIEEYMLEISYLDSNFNNRRYTYENTINGLTFKLSDFVVTKPGTTYDIRVRPKKNGEWLEYGSICTVTVQYYFSLYLVGESNSYWDWKENYAVKVSEVDLYRFEFEYNDEEKLTYETSNNYFIWRQVPNIKSNTTYYVRVSGRINGVWTRYGQVRILTCPSVIGQRTSLIEEVSIKEIQIATFPNPYADTFQISYPSDVEGTVNVSIYDMSGRQVVQSQHEAATLSEQYFGQGLSAGIYNVILEHGTEVRTLRVIKQ